MMATKSTTVLLLCGLPGSGKSELARQIITQEQRSDAHRRGACVWIEYDSIQQQLQLEKSSCSSCSSSLEAWRRTRQVALDKLKEELLERNDDDRREDNVWILMDDNFQLRSMRKDVHRVCQQALTSNRRLILYFVILWLDTPFNICLERNEKRPVDRRVPEEVIYNIHRSWEPPDADKASWEVNHCRLSEVTTIDDIGRYLQSSAFQPVQPPPPDRTESQQAEREKTRANVLHQCDGFLRTFVGCVAKIHRGSVQDANQARKKILQDLKNEQNETTVLSSCSPYDDLTELFLKELLANNHDDDFWTEHRIKDLRSSIHNAHNQQ